MSHRAMLGALLLLPQQASAITGMTPKQLAAEPSLPAARTAGRHRRYLLGDVLRLAGMPPLPTLDPRIPDPSTIVWMATRAPRTVVAA